MQPSLKYAVVERERRFLVARIPDGDVERREVIDRYLTGTRLRLREVRSADGIVTRKLGQKVRLGDDASALACTNLYLDEAEWALLAHLPARVLRKTRHVVRRDGWLVAVDEHEDGTLVAEVDDGASPPAPVPAWLEVLRDVTADEAWTGAALAR
ncbi:hypothetical protein [Phycicoccus sonneratiae]|uniref:CYTH domain-containing protein n=1 Tax=Phycicoccus sonneratiae TaxID=2807628 RepID=A0ABS2CPJ8_9MICO|nr:hypothetical protein [Phycicoccus sonneraticus]MBM6401812.1 hypothetical protein [Phycicoccus sonneraticus]